MFPITQPMFSICFKVCMTSIVCICAYYPTLKFIYLFIIVLILLVSFYYDVPSEFGYNSHIMEMTTICFYAVSASPCQCLFSRVSPSLSSRIRNGESLGRREDSSRTLSFIWLNKARSGNRSRILLFAKLKLGIGPFSGAFYIRG